MRRGLRTVVLRIEEYTEVFPWLWRCGSWGDGGEGTGTRLMPSSDLGFSRELGVRACHHLNALDPPGAAVTDRGAHSR